MNHGSLQKGEIFVASGQRLGDEQVVDFEAQPFRTSGVLVLNSDEAFLPALGKEGGLLSDTLGVVSEGLVKRGQLADAAFDDVGALGMVSGKKVGFDGDTH